MSGGRGAQQVFATVSSPFINEIKMLTVDSEVSGTHRDTNPVLAGNIRAREL